MSEEAIVSVIIITIPVAADPPVLPHTLCKHYHYLKAGPNFDHDGYC